MQEANEQSEGIDRSQDLDERAAPEPEHSTQEPEPQQPPESPPAGALSPQEGSSIVVETTSANEPIERVFDVVDDQARADFIGGLMPSDDGNARCIAMLFGSRLRFITAIEKWMVWNGRSWNEATIHQMELFAVQAAKQRLLALARAKNVLPMPRIGLAQWAIASESQGKLRAALEALTRQPGIPTSHDTWNANPLHLGLREGVLDLSTGQLLPNDPNLLVSKKVGCAYDPDAVCPRTEQFINELACGDEALGSYIRATFGYTLTGYTTEQVLFLLYGTGRNGKSTLLNLMTRLMGDYARTASMSSFTQLDNPGRAREDLARLAGARLVTARETSDGKRFDEGTVKSITGGDPITARFVYGHLFEYLPSLKLWLATNDLPEIRGDDEGIWRRIHLIPLRAQFPVGADRGLEQQLHEELPGLLNAAVRWSQNWQSQRLTMPDAVREASAQYRAESDLVGNFLREACIPDRTRTTSSRDLYQHHRAWCAAFGYRALTQQSLGRRLKDRGYERTRLGSGHHAWVGIGLQDF